MNYVNMINKSAVQEVRSNYYSCCNSGALSNKELIISILEPLIRNRSLSEVADDLLQNGLHQLASLSEFEISTTYGLNEKQSFHLMSVMELGRRLMRKSLSEDVIIRYPQDVFNVVSDLRELDKEHFVVLFLNSKNSVIGRETISIGTLNASLVHPREVFKAAIRRGAASIIVSHNHPSGNPTPSPEDIHLTQRLAEAGEVVGIELLDHIIVGQTCLSMKEHGHFCPAPTAGTA
ncbi:RadC family protein [Paenibacillus sp. MMO-177]|uniref:RadC family protein n=1 Tax=Paenibacillus sp. MMO-177 TaxID=3081289 RepID=UPI003017E0CA